MTSIQNYAIINILNVYKGIKYFYAISNKIKCINYVIKNKLVIFC